LLRHILTPLNILFAFIAFFNLQSVFKFSVKCNTELDSIAIVPY